MGILGIKRNVGAISIGLLFTVFSSAVFADDLESRVKAKWGAMSIYDFGTVYKFLTPAYKAVFTKNLFVHKFSKDILWNLTKIEDIKYDSATNLATVDVVVETATNSEGSATKTDVVNIQIKEKWLHIDDQWWHSPNE